MKKRFLQFSLYFLMAFCVFFSFKHTAFAAEGLLVSPVSYQINVDPGSEYTDKVIVRNNYNETINFKLDTENFKQIDINGTAQFEGTNELDDKNTSLAKWIVFDETEGSLQSGQTKYINFTIKVPENASIGGHYAGIFAQKDQETINKDNTAIGLSLKVGSLVMLTVNGDIKKEANISNLTFDKFITELGSSNFQFTLNNTGNTFFESNAKLQITNIFGKKTEIDLGTHLVPHNNSRVFSGDWIKKYPFGFYRAQIIAPYDGNTSATTTFAFWAFPWQITLPSIFILIGILLMLISIFKKHKDNDNIY